MSGTDAPAASLVVCTRDRPVALAHGLAAVRVAAAQAGGAGGIELIVVDTSASASARTLVGSLAPRPGLTLRYRHAPGRGLARARNAGLEAARGAIIAFADDDCRIAPHYFAGLHRAFAAADAGTLVIGGLAEPADDPPHPLCFPDASSFAIDRDALTRIGLFDARFGPGGPLRWGEVADYLLRARRAGVAVVRSPHLGADRFGAPPCRTPPADTCFGAGALFAKHLRGAPGLARALGGVLRGCGGEQGSGLPRSAALAAMLGGMRRYWALAAAGSGQPARSTWSW